MHPYACRCNPSRRTARNRSRTTRRTNVRVLVWVENIRWHERGGLFGSRKTTGMLHSPRCCLLLSPLVWREVAAHPGSDGSCVTSAYLELYRSSSLYLFLGLPLHPELAQPCSCEETSHATLHQQRNGGEGRVPNSRVSLVMYVVARRSAARPRRRSLTCLAAEKSLFFQFRRYAVTCFAVPQIHTQQILDRSLAVCMVPPVIISRPPPTASNGQSAKQS